MPESTLGFLGHLVKMSFQWWLLIPDIPKGTKGPWKRRKEKETKKKIYSSTFHVISDQKGHKNQQMGFPGEVLVLLYSPRFLMLPRSDLCTEPRETKKRLCPTCLFWFGWFLSSHSFVIKTYLGERSLSPCVWFLQKPFKDERWSTKGTVMGIMWKVPEKKIMAFLVTILSGFSVVDQLTNPTRDHLLWKRWDRNKKGWRARK